MSIDFDPTDAGNTSVVLRFLVDKLGADDQAELQELLSNPGGQLAADSFLRSLPAPQRDNLMALDGKVRRQAIATILKSRRQAVPDTETDKAYAERFPNAGRLS